jgi:hypothetical protein
MNAGSVGCVRMKNPVIKPTVAHYWHWHDQPDHFESRSIIGPFLEPVFCMKANGRVLGFGPDQGRHRHSCSDSGYE